MTATEGDTVIIIGAGFGVAPGIVTMDMTVPVSVNSWSDTEISVVLPHLAPQPHIPYVQVLSPTGVLLAFQDNGFITVLPRLPARHR